MKGIARERSTVKVESYSYGVDELLGHDVVSGGVTVFIEDGVEDGDETVDQYVIPTWGVESVQDVLTCDFPHDEDEDGNLNSLWTPEFNGANQPTWNEHFLSDIAWWNIYLTQADAGDTPLRTCPPRRVRACSSASIATATATATMTAPNSATTAHYQPAIRSALPRRRPSAPWKFTPSQKCWRAMWRSAPANLVTVTLALENTGTFDAYGIDAVMHSPDATTTIGNNTVGGNGKVRPGNDVAVGSMIKLPVLAQWGSSTAKPYAGGSYAGDADRTYTFTAATPGVVGTGSTTVNWSDGTVGGTIAWAAAITRRFLLIDLNHGLQVGFNTGVVAAGASFMVQALSPREIFTYTVNSDPFIPPVIVVSYSDPQGSHCFVTPGAVDGAIRQPCAPQRGDAQGVGCAGRRHGAFRRRRRQHHQPGGQQPAPRHHRRRPSAPEFRVGWQAGVGKVLHVGRSYRAELSLPPAGRRRSFCRLQSSGR